MCLHLVSGIFHIHILFFPWIQTKLDCSFRTTLASSLWTLSWRRNRFSFISCPTNVRGFIALTFKHSPASERQRERESRICQQCCEILSKQLVLWLISNVYQHHNLPTKLLCPPDAFRTHNKERHCCNENVFQIVGYGVSKGVLLNSPKCAHIWHPFAQYLEVSSVSASVCLINELMLPLLLSGWRRCGAQTPAMASTVWMDPHARSSST